MSQVPPAGWYPDPETRGHSWRWWDGAQWHAPPTWPALAYGRPDPEAAPRARSQAHRIGSWLRYAMVGNAVYTLLLFASLGLVFHSIRHDVFATRPGGTPHISGRVIAVELFSAPLSLFSLAFTGLLIAWILQAGKYAEAMGWPTVRSRTLGAFSVLIPIVNLWWPYEALRDAYPPGDEHAILLRWWLTYLLIQLPVLAAMFVVALTASTGTIAIVVAAAALLLGCSVVFGWQAVDDLDAAQQRTVG